MEFLWRVMKMDMRARVEMLRDGDGRAAEALFRLNRYARMTQDRAVMNFIYQIKGEMLREFGRRFPYQATIEKQRLECYPCRGTGKVYRWDYPEDVEEKCRKCDGTGVWREHLLYSLHFNIGGRHYNWHQPKELVDWTVNLESDPAAFGWPEYKTWQGDGYEQIKREEAEYATLVCLAWLGRKGRKMKSEIPGRITLREAMRYEVHVWRNRHVKPPF